MMGGFILLRKAFTSPYSTYPTISLPPPGFSKAAGIGGQCVASSPKIDRLQMSLLKENKGTALKMANFDVSLFSYKMRNVILPEEGNIKLVLLGHVSLDSKRVMLASI